MRKEWIPIQGKMVWIKVFSNWSSGTYIGFDTVKNIHIVREDESGGGHLISSSDVLPYSAMPNELKKQTFDEASSVWDYQSFGAGAEWQEKQMYSEDEVLKLWNWLNDGFILRKSLPTKDELIGYFEQFKKTNNESK